MLQVLLRPIEDYLGVFGHGLLGDLLIAREEERNSLLRLELGRFLVADLIPTDSAYVFKVAARTPVADTKEWEAEHTIVFKSTGKVSLGSGTAPKSDDNDSRDKAEAKNGTAVVEEDKERLLLDEVHMRWGLEFYAFKRSVRFDTALQEDEEGEGEEEEGGEEEGQSDDGDVSEVAPSVGDTGVRLVNDALSKLALVCLALAVGLH